MTKQKILLLIPLVTIVGLLIYCWIIILFTNVSATWRHYLALLLCAGLIFLFFKSFAKAVLGTGLYLIIATCNLLSVTPSVVTNSFGLRIGSIELQTPTFQLLSFGLLLLFFVLNFITLVDIYLDYKEVKNSK